MWKSSSALIGPKGSLSCPIAGLSSTRLLGSIAAEGSPRIGRTAIERRLRSCTSPQFGSCSENSAIRPKVSGQTLAVLIGVGATLASQSYREEAREAITTWVPSLGRLLPVSATMTLASAETSPELGQQLKPIAFDLALIRRSVEQLAANLKEFAAKQEEIAHDAATLQAVERDLRQNISSVPPPGAVQIPRPKPGQPSAQSLGAHYTNPQ